MRDSSLLTRMETRLFCRSLRAYNVTYKLIAEVLEISESQAFRDAHDVVPNKEAIPAPPLTLADAVAFLNAEGFEVIAMAAQPSRQSLRRHAA